MQKFSEFQPTTFDCKGLGSDGQENWLVLPCSQTRDSECVDRSNFETAVSMLGGESDSVQVHHFGHWGPGWFEIIVIDPNDATTLKIAENIESSLADYPVLDEQDLSEKEIENENQCWESFGRSDFIQAIESKFKLTLGCPETQYTDDQIDELLHNLQEDTNRDPETCGNDEVHFFIEDLVKALSFEMLLEALPDIDTQAIFNELTGEAVTRLRCTSFDEACKKDYRLSWAKQYFDAGDIDHAIEELEKI